jgi:hypothetical protein
MTNGPLSILRIVVAIVVVLSFGDAAIAQAQRAPSAATVMTEELMARLIKFTREVEVTGSLSAATCKVLNFCDGTKNMPLKYCTGDSTDGKHHFGLRPEDPDNKDIFIVVLREGNLEVYLTDKTGKLRAAAVEENGIARLITNEKAAAKFKAELAQYAKEAAEQLPPTR